MYKLAQLCETCEFHRWVGDKVYCAHPACGPAEVRPTMTCPEWKADTTPLLVKIDELRKAARLVLPMADRIAKQSDLLSQRAERKSPTYTDGGGI